MDKSDIATLIDSHFEEMTDWSKKSLAISCKLKLLQMIYLLNKSPRNYISPKLH